MKKFTGRVMIGILAAMMLLVAGYGVKKFVYERSDDGRYPFFGGAQLPPLKPFEVWEATIRISSCDVDAENIRVRRDHGSRPRAFRGRGAVDKKLG